MKKKKKAIQKILTNQESLNQIKKKNNNNKMKNKSKMLAKRNSKILMTKNWLLKWTTMMN